MNANNTVTRACKKCFSQEIQARVLEFFRTKKNVKLNIFNF